MYLGQSKTTRLQIVIRTNAFFTCLRCWRSDKTGDNLYVSLRIAVLGYIKPPVRLPPCGGFYLWGVVLLLSILYFYRLNIQGLVACRNCCEWWHDNNKTLYSSIVHFLVAGVALPIGPGNPNRTDVDLVATTHSYAVKR